MALLQLTLPDEAPTQRCRKRVVGIDLGTTNSLVATVIDGKAQIITGPAAQRMLPSVIDYRDGEPVTVGQPAHGAPPAAGTTRVYSAKRLMGLGWQDIVRAGNLSDYPFTCVPDSNPVEIEIGKGKSVAPVQVAARLLTELADWGATAQAGKLEGAVVTVPAYFDDAQRQATKDAAKLAGLHVLRLLNEPTAAALAYGLDQDAEGIYVVCDMGGGTFDVSVLALRRGLFQVLATDGDTRLGGDDFDAALARLLQVKSGKVKVGARLGSLLAVARRAKEALTDSNTVAIEVGDAKLEVSVDEFNAATATLLERSIAILTDCVKRAGVRDELHAVIMVGGSTRMPGLRAAVAAALPVVQHTELNPDEVVAFGAAAQADILAGNRADDWLLLDVNPLSLGIETMGGLVERIIPRNSSIPIARAQEFTTHKDGQSALAIHVVQGERDQAQDCRSLARFALRGIPPMTAGTARVQVTYRLDADGLLTVTASERTTGTKAHVEIKPSYGLSEDEVVKMLAASRVHAQEDMQARALAEARVGADSLLTMLGTALTRDAELVGEALPAIEAVMAKVRTLQAGSDVDALQAAVQELDRVSAGFAARRMQAAMRKALTGKSVRDLDETLTGDAAGTAD